MGHHRPNGIIPDINSHDAFGFTTRCCVGCLQKPSVHSDFMMAAVVHAKIMLRMDRWPQSEIEGAFQLSLCLGTSSKGLLPPL